MTELFQEILQGILVFAQLAFEFGDFWYLPQLGFFYQGQDITHPKNTGGHPVGVKRFKCVKLFAHPDKFDRFAGDGLTERRLPRVSPSRLVQNDPIQPQTRVKDIGHIYRVLSGHRVYNQQVS